LVPTTHLNRRMGGFREHMIGTRSFGTPLCVWRYLWAHCSATAIESSSVIETTMIAPCEYSCSTLSCTKFAKNLHLSSFQSPRKRGGDHKGSRATQKEMKNNCNNKPTGPMAVLRHQATWRSLQIRLNRAHRPPLSVFYKSPQLSNHIRQQSGSFIRGEGNLHVRQRSPPAIIILINGLPKTKNKRTLII
jgi:hypothetical protein